MILLKNGLSRENLDGESTATCLKPENFGKVVNCSFVISQMHVKVHLVSLAISDCLIKVVKYIAPC